jgi:DNA mismatch repair protein MutS2
VAVDLRTLRPLYTLQMGEPGTSHALGIAEGLGLDPEVVGAARRAGPPERRALEALLADAASARAAAEEEREAAARAREEAEAARAEAGRRADDLAARIARAREAATAERAAARREAQAELGELTRDLADLRAQIAAARREEAGRGEAAMADERARERDRRLGAASRAAARAREELAPPVPEVGRRSPPLEVGDLVVDPEMGFRGRVLAIDGGRAEVQGGSARMRLPLARLVIDGAAATAPAPEPTSPVPAPLAVPASLEIDVRGWRAEEARATVRQRIDSASVAGLPQVRVIHGHGTGALRAAVRDELARHPLVERATPAPPDEGGDGATIAYLGGL